MKIKAAVMAMVSLTVLGWAQMGQAQDMPSGTSAEAKSDEEQGQSLTDITVTATRRAEKLQDVPVSITAFSSEAIERAGINQVQDFIRLTPNVNIRNSYRAGEVFITIRGITSTQNGWAPIAYSVDGVQAMSIDQISQGILSDVERIEVLKGPQGVLYGAGAIAGAINVITRKPTNDFSGQLRASYGNGEDIRLSGAISGPIVKDKVMFRISGYHHGLGGYIETTDGDKIDFDNLNKISGRLYFDLDDLTIDLTGGYTKAHSGAVTNDKVPTAAQKDDFSIKPQRGIIGYEDRTYYDASARIEWKLDFATLTSVTGYNKIDQALYGTASWGKPPTGSTFGAVGCATCLYTDAWQRTANNFESFTEDMRLVSNTDQSLRWLIGASYNWRKAKDYLALGGFLTTTGAIAYNINRPDLRKDSAWGVYGEVNYDVTPKLTITGGVRYDRDKYNSTQYTDQSYTVPVPTPDGLVTQRADNDKWQPKAVITYKWTPDIMTYASYALGFRFGFYNSGSGTAPESLKNYEAGFKTSWWNGRIHFNGAVFHQDYSDQQVTRVTQAPPFRTTTNVPKSTLDGFELEAAALVVRGLELNAGYGYIKGTLSTGEHPPALPKHTFNFAVSHTLPITDALELQTRVDYRYVSPYFSGSATVPYEILEQSEFNLSTILRRDNIHLGFFAKNLFDRRQAYSLSSGNAGFTRSYNLPRTYYVEIGMKF